MEKIQGPHDKIFKRVMTDRENAVSLLVNILPEAVRKHLVLEEIFYEKDTFVPAHLGNYYSDLLTSVPIKGGGITARIYFLFEHKSFGGHNTPIQMLRYMLEIWDKYDREIRKPGEYLPVIIPVLIAHARDGWKYKKVSDYIDFPSEDFKAYVPDFDFVLYDAVTENPDDYEFVETLKALLFIWRHYYSPDFMEHMVRVFRLFNRIFPDAKFKDFVISIMEYLSAVRSEEEFIDILETARNELSGGDEIMGTIADMFRREGREQGIVLGRQEGRQEGRREMLIKSLLLKHDVVKPFIIDKIKSIESIELLDKLFEMTYKCNTLDEFNEYLNKVTDN
jgi:predicted transposase/invertase (TIGR01784 family)